MNTYFNRSALLLSTALGLLLFPGAQAMAQTTAAGAQTTDQSAQAGGVQEVIVTAQKRRETTLNVPMGVTALTGQQLVRQQAYTLADFVGQVPGLNLTGTFGGAQLVIRGIASSAGDPNAPVSTYIDETPLVGVGPFSGGSITTPDIDTYDMARIEVLKGPQGTLYGADALGGILKYVTNAPDPSGYHASMEAGANSVAYGGAGYDLHGMVNVPLGNNLAFRLVGYYNDIPGFIDDPLRGAKDINSNRIYGGRAALLWTPTANFSIRLNALYHWHSWGDLGAEDVSANTLRPVNVSQYALNGNLASLTPGCNLCQERYAAQPGNNELQYYNATINWDLGLAKLMSSTTYYKYEWSQVRELTDGFSPTVDFYYDVGSPLTGNPLVPGAGTIVGPAGFWAGDQYHGDSWVQEVRLSSNDQGPLQWQTGVYYTTKNAVNFQPYAPIDINKRTVLFADTFTETVPTTYQEIAAFADLDYHITPTFDVSAGGRYSYQNQTFSQVGTGLDELAGVAQPKISMNESVTTYSVDARWHFIPGSMVYARVATGFVPGGPNDAAFNTPPQPPFGPSTTINYEVGLKSSLLDNRLTAELAVYKIDWSHIQLYSLNTATGYTSLTNGGTATSEGVEWNFNYVPFRGLTLDFNGAYTDAYLTQNAPADVGGLKGDRLPITPLWQLSASGNYERPLFGDVSGFAGFNWRYLDSRYAQFEPIGAGRRQVLPAYSIVDLRAGIETRRWTLTAYVKNVGNVIAFSYLANDNSFVGANGPQSAYVTTPRTVGVEFTANF